MVKNERRREKLDSRAGRKVFTLQTQRACEPVDYADSAGNVSGFSLYAGVAARADERKTGASLSLHQMSGSIGKALVVDTGRHCRYRLKTPWHDGTTHVIFEPLDFIARLAALISRSKTNVTHLHGMFSPKCKHRALITPAGRGKNNKRE